jgi:SAM-dependent methyltransferase
MLWLFLEKTRRELFEKPLSLLHIAPETCYQRQFKLLGKLRYVTADIASPVADCRLDLCRLPFQSGAFDVILCNHVLEHIPDDRRAMQELCRVLKPGGWGVLQVPMDYGRHMTFEDDTILSPEERERAFGQRDHVRVYGMDYVDRLRGAGFTVEVVDFVTEIEGAVVLRYGLNNDEQVYLCTKPGETSETSGECAT